MNTVSLNFFKGEGTILASLRVPAVAGFGEKCNFQVY